MGPARIYPWRKMHRSRAPSIAPGTFFVAQPWADCITNMPGFNLRQAQAALTILAAIVTNKLPISEAWMAVVFFAAVGVLSWTAGRAVK